MDNTSPAPVADRLLTAQECATYLGVALSTVRAWTSRRRLCVVKLHGGRSCRYRRADLERLVRRWSRPALAEAAGGTPRKGDEG